MQNYITHPIQKWTNEENMKLNPIQWCKENKYSYSLLSKAVLYYLNVPATSAPSKRIFSLAGNIVIKKEQGFSQDM